ncbi:hypothetical protein CCH01_07270 [Clostridium chauvoei JF4335]|uniref:Uncharacterized protein n=2 Tax=Clostridium chauvoei TaxID=46867 RepID=A0A1U6J320_9CLOT|nr:hypothetical protein CCH01_07270 [Clostridium chauvoei JF4335]
MLSNSIIERMCLYMPKSNKTKEPQQKGERRQRLHGNQNNIGNDKNRAEYTDFNGNPIE